MRTLIPSPCPLPEGKGEIFQGLIIHTNSWLDNKTLCRSFAVRKMAISATFPNVSESLLSRLKILAFNFVDNSSGGSLRAFRQIDGIVGIKR